MMLKAKILAELVVPKFGYSENECEDAYSIQESKSKKTLKIAIADGATESSFSKEWAQILVDNLTNFRALTRRMLLKNLSNLYKIWEKEVGNKELPWYAEIKMDKGAFSTILALTLNLKDRQLSSFAIGDCCWFQLRNGELICSFPISLSDEYHNHPYLLRSKTSNIAEISNNIKEVKKRELAKGDYLFIMSDALSDWFSYESKNNGKPWNILLRLFEGETSNVLEHWLNEQRENKVIKNDDTTLIILEFN